MGLASVLDTATTEESVTYLAHALMTTAATLRTLHETASTSEASGVPPIT